MEEKMKDLAELNNTKEFLITHGIMPKKRYGQNFLTDRRVLNSIIEGAGITKRDTVLEIGPGIGTLTQALCRSAGRVIAVEIDQDMLPLLKESLGAYDNYELINADILRVDIREIIEGQRPAQTGEVYAGGAFKITANLPYYITTPIIMKLLRDRLPVESITVMVQKEVAERMQALPGGKDYGALSLAVQYYTEAQIITLAPASCFFPSPEVESAVIKLRLRSAPPVSVSSEERLFRIIKAAFMQRRKKLSNALAGDPGLGVSRETVEQKLAVLGLRFDIRGERLSLEQFALLTELLGQ